MILKSVNLAVVALVALSVIAAPVFAQPGAYDQALEEAETLVLERDYKSAIKAYGKAQKLAGAPTYECCYGLAKAFINVGAYKNGVESVREALSLAGNVGQELQAYNLLGLGLFAGGGADEARLEQAVEAFEKVLEITRGLSPEQQGGTNLARYNLGVSLLKLGRDDKGIAVLNDFLAAEPTGPEAETARTYVDNPLRARVALMPEFEVVTLDGEYLTSEELAGKVVLLDFWGTWCPPCVVAIPHLKRLSRRSEKSPFVLLSISNDSDVALLRNFVAEHGMTWPQVWDEDHKLFGEVFKVSTFPTHILIDHEGEIVYRQSGWGTGIQSNLNSRIARALRAARKAGQS